MTLALAIIAAVLLLFPGGYEKPLTPPGTGTRRQHRAAYSKKGFKI